MAKLENIEGIGSKYASDLRNAGVNTIEGLLEKGSTKSGRKEIETKTGIAGKLILKWVNMADLFRIKGIGEEYSELLEVAGVDTVPELAQRNAANLAAKMKELNIEKELVRSIPSESMVERWINQAKELPRVIEY